MPKYFYIALFTVIVQHLVAQKPFVGSLEYKLVSVDLINKDTIEGKLFIYALDSLVRYNYLMSDGKKQESIHHIHKHKLLSLIEIDGQFFAVQIKDTAQESSDFQYQKTTNNERVLDFNCKEAVVSFPKGQVPLLYTKKINARYFVGLKGAPGLPVKGQIPTDDGYMAFELQKWDNRTPPIQLFIPDKKYKVLPLEAFLEWTQTQNSHTPQD